MEDDKLIEMTFPMAGIDVAHSYEGQPGGTTPSGTNVRAYEPTSDRNRGGSRPGLSQYIPERVNGIHLVQHLNLIVDPSATATPDYDPPTGVVGAPNPLGGGNGPVPGSTTDPTEAARNPTGRVIRTGGTGIRPSRTRKRTPIIVWADPAAISSTTALSATQLNAVAIDPVTSLVVAGVYTYTPLLGTTLPAGPSQPLKVDFVPSNQTLYGNVSKVVHINVTSLDFVQGAAGANAAGFGVPVASLAVAYGSNVTAGNFLLVAVETHANAHTVSLSDTRGNTWTQIGSYLADSGIRTLSLWKATANGTGANTVTATPSASSSFMTVAVLEYKNVSSVDGSATNSAASSTNLTTTTVPFSSMNEAVIGVFIQDNTVANGFTAGLGFTLRAHIDATVEHGAIYVVDSLAEVFALAATGTLNLGDDYLAFGISLIPV